MAKPDPDTPARRKRFIDYCAAKGWGGNGERWRVVEIAKACNKPVSKVSNLLNETGSFGASIAREFELEQMRALLLSSSSEDQKLAAFDSAAESLIEVVKPSP